MIVLGIETSCDETAISVVEASLTDGKPLFDIHSNIVASQIDVHKKFGGVVPNLAAREHVTNLPPVLQEALKKAKAPTIDLIAVATAPGLIPCLLTGTHFARTLSWRWGIPAIGVDHMEAHLYSPLIEKNMAPLPAIALIVSGGHTMIVRVDALGDHTVLGETVDDAAGEAFDKVARMLDLGYPGGPAISKAAEKGNPHAFQFPRPMKDSGDYRFSFSGLKTAVLYAIQDLEKNRPDPFPVNDIAASFQQAAIDVLISKTKQAATKYNAKSVWLSGGVAANTLLRASLQKTLGDTPLIVPSISLSTDNGAMIAATGALKWMLTKPASNWRTLQAATLHHLKPWI